MKENPLRNAKLHSMIERKNTFSIEKKQRYALKQVYYKEIHD